MAADDKKIGIRQLMITTMFSMFVAVVVFEILSYLYLVPLMSRQQLQIVAMSNRIEALERNARAEREEQPSAPAAAMVHTAVAAPSGPAAVPASAPEKPAVAVPAVAEQKAEPKK